MSFDRVALQQRNSPLEFISGLKGLAILMVIFHHWGGHGIPFRGESYSHLLTFQLTQFGKFGVSLFFMVSSFTLYRSFAQLKLTERHPTFIFYCRRFFRIFPTWWLCLVLYSSFKSVPLETYQPHFFMLFGFFPKPEAVFGGEWSLFVEETFYLLLPLGIFQVHSALGLTGLLVATVCLRYLWLGYLGPLLGWAGQPATNFPLVHWYCFVLGLCLRKIYEEPPRGLKFLKDVSFVRLLNLGLLCSLFFSWPKLDWGHGDLAVSMFLFSVFLSAMSGRGIIAKITQSKWLGLFGVCCYSIYLFHELVIKYVQSTCLLDFLVVTGLTDKPLSIRLYVTAPIFFACCLAVGLVFHFSIERWSIQLGRRLSALLFSEGRQKHDISVNTSTL